MAGYIELTIDQGASFNTSLTITEANGSFRNLASSNAISQMRKSYNSTTYHTIAAEIVDGANGVISLSMGAEETANVKAGRYVYDVKTVDSTGYTTRILEGVIIVTPGVTR